MPVVHACMDARTGTRGRTFCGIEVRLKADGSGWVTASHRPVLIETRRSADVTCGRCWRSMD